MTEDPVIAIDCRMQVLPKSYYKTVMLQVVLTKKKKPNTQTNKLFLLHAFDSHYCHAPWLSSLAELPCMQQ